MHISKVREILKQKRDRVENEARAKAQNKPKVKKTSRVVKSASLKKADVKKGKETKGKATKDAVSKRVSPARGITKPHDLLGYFIPKQKRTGVEKTCSGVGVSTKSLLKSSFLYPK